MTVLKFKETDYETVSDNVKRKIIHNENLMTVLIDFEGGPWKNPQPFHSHPHEQTSYIASGKIMFYCEGEKDQELETGDMFSVPTGKQHTIKLLSETARLVDNFYPLREDFLN